MLFSLSKFTAVILILCIGLVMMARYAGRLAPGYVFSYASAATSGVELYDGYRNLRRELFYEPYVGFLESWSPDGQRLAYSVVYDLPRLYVFDLDPYTSTQLITGTESQYHAVWSPNSRYLAFNSVEYLQEGNRTHLYIMDMQTGQLQNFTNSHVANSAAWSPDSRYLAFYRDERVVIANVVTGDLDTRFSSSTTEFGTWSPDGRRFSIIEFVDERPYFTSNSLTFTGEIRLADTASGTVASISTFATTWRYYNRTVLQWSRDGQHLLFISLHEGESDLFRADLATGTVHNLTSHLPLFLRRFWLSGPEQITFEAQDDDQPYFRLYYVVQLDGSDLYPINASQPFNQEIVSVNLSRDELYVLYTLGSETWMLKLFDFQSRLLSDLRGFNGDLLSVAWMP